MKAFAKIFETQECGQILVKIDRHPDDETPEVRIYFQPEELGVCSVALSWPDNDAGWDNAEKAFEHFDQTKAEKIVKEQLVFLAKELGVQG